MRPYIVQVFFSSFGALCFGRFARAGLRLWDWFGGLKFCRTYGAFLCIMLLSGVYTPACILSSLRDFGLGEWTHEPCVPTGKIGRHSFVGCLLFLIVIDGFNPI